MPDNSGLDSALRASGDFSKRKSENTGTLQGVDLKTHPFFGNSPVSFLGLPNASNLRLIVPQKILS